MSWDQDLTLFRTTSLLSCYTLEVIVVMKTCVWSCSQLYRKLGLEWRWTHFGSSATTTKLFRWRKLSLKAGKSSWQVTVCTFLLTGCDRSIGPLKVVDIAATDRLWPTIVTVSVLCTLKDHTFFRAYQTLSCCLRVRLDCKECFTNINFLSYIITSPPFASFHFSPFSPLPSHFFPLTLSFLTPSTLIFPSPSLPSFPATKQLQNPASVPCVGSETVTVVPALFLGWRS